jgi:hypothetical protein
MSYVVSGIAIIVCAGAGAWVAWMLVSSLGWVGVGGAALAAFVGMVVATLLFALGVVLGKALRWIR